MLEKLKKAFTISLDIMLSVSELEESVLREDEDRIKDSFAKLKDKIKMLIQNVKGEKDGYK